jgi:hypothetical protein
MMRTAQDDDAAGLRDLIRQTEIAGAQRRALVLHADRLPAALGRPHHHRLARDALQAIASADRAQTFELSRGRMAIVWRDRGGRELDTCMAALKHLLADLPGDQAVAPGELVSLYDLPDQAAWLADELEPAAVSAKPVDTGLPMDAALLVRLEEALQQAALAQFMRWRPVRRVTTEGTAVAWEERYVSLRALAADLCPGRTLHDGSWLFRRLTRTLDRRVLSHLSNGMELAGNRALALTLTVGALLSPEFMRFDSALPATLRGHVVVRLDAADMVSDTAAFVFARNFVRARGYRLLLRLPGGVVDPVALGVEFIEVRPGQKAPAGAAAVVCGVGAEKAAREAGVSLFRPV